MDNTVAVEVVEVITETGVTETETGEGVEGAVGISTLDLRETRVHLLRTDEARRRREGNRTHTSHQTTGQGMRGVPAHHRFHARPLDHGVPLLQDEAIGRL